MKKIGQIKISYGLWRYSLKKIKHYLEISYIKERVNNPKATKVFNPKITYRNNKKIQTWVNYSGFKIVALSSSKTLFFYNNQNLTIEDLKIIAFFTEHPLYLDLNSGGYISLNDRTLKVGRSHLLYSKMLKKLNKKLK